MSDRRGAALILVLWILVALGAVSSGVAAATRRTGGVADNYRARTVARYAAESGVALAVATLERELSAAGEAPARRDFLNRLDAALGELADVSLGDARIALALVDPGARLDVNAADAPSLARLLSYLTDPIEAERVAAAIRAHVGGTSERDAAFELSAARALRSLEELERIPGVPLDLVRRARPYLTVDGDGTINRATASDTVRSAAAGELRDEPSRVVVVSRGWRDGHALTHEIEAVYAIVGAELTLIRWRERDL